MNIRRVLTALAAGTAAVPFHTAAFHRSSPGGPDAARIETELLVRRRDEAIAEPPTQSG
ncbi:MAG: hypothetical protein QM658_07405 [Gordonia sp. (in: high G+C Gram-positive bacteria)]